MGLDMFLHKVRKEEVAYWHKANAIHGWFCRKFEEKYGQKLENCEEFYLEKEDLINLRNDCEKVLKASKLDPSTKLIADTKVAKEILPTTSGFFFGSTDYNEGYIQDLKETVEAIENILETVNFERYDIVYSVSW